MIKYSYIYKYLCVYSVFLKKGGNLIVVQQYYKWELVL
jgi:hypothetical protein